MISRLMCVAAVASTLAALGAASPLAAQSKKHCPDPAPDSTTGQLVYQKCHVDREAKSIGSPPLLHYQPAPLGGRPVPQEIEYKSRVGMRVVVSSSPTGVTPRGTRAPGC